MVPGCEREVRNQEVAESDDIPGVVQNDGESFRPELQHLSTRDPQLHHLLGRLLRVPGAVFQLGGSGESDHCFVDAIHGVDGDPVRQLQSKPAGGAGIECAAVTVRLLIGILTHPNSYRRRDLLRWVYGVQTPKFSQIDVRFVFCNLTTEEQNVMIALEILRYDDIIILNCKENMDDGKTYTYFSSMNDIFDSPLGFRPAPYDYIMKADDDTFILLTALEESLKGLAREDMYYGLVTPCKNMKTTPDHYMSGMGYILSWDLAEHIQNSSYAKSHQVGPEDLLLGTWLKEGKVARNRYNVKPRFYDFPGSHQCDHPLTPDTIAIHRLKEQKHWVRAVTYFNFTKELKKSKLYHIP